MRHAILLVLALAAPGFAAAAAPAPTMFPVPAGATNVGHIVLEPGVAEEDYFVLTEKYPASSAADHYDRILSGWHPCYSKPKQQWMSFGDVARGKEIYIHLLSRHWVNPEGNTSVTLLLKYTSDGIKHRAVPDNDRQYVFVDRNKSRTAVREFSALGITCQKSK